MSELSALRGFLEDHPVLAQVAVASARGSTPREAGAWMLVSESRTFGTIGGGHLEYAAIDRARALLRSDEMGPVRTETALGPEIGQCCGGRVVLNIQAMDDAPRTNLLREVRAEHAALPSILMFGSGHVGHALAASLALLPLKVEVIETRADALQGLPPGVGAKLFAMPEQALRAAGPGSGFVILTHDHALDFLLAAEALKREDAVYVGMIGSRTKKATFRRWFRENAGGTEAQFARLVSPIGGDRLDDKRPAVIAALAAAEIATAVFAARLVDCRVALNSQ